MLRSPAGSATTCSTHWLSSSSRSKAPPPCLWVGDWQWWLAVGLQQIPQIPSRFAGAAKAGREYKRAKLWSMTIPFRLKGCLTAPPATGRSHLTKSLDSKFLSVLHFSGAGQYSPSLSLVSSWRAGSCMTTFLILHRYGHHPQKSCPHSDMGSI